MKKLLYLLLFFTWIPFVAQAGNEPIKVLIENFLSTDWPTVSMAKEKLENLGSVCIPEIIGLMENCSVSKLQNTGDLIYPGAEKFFGHGQIIDYNIDDACVRAGWLLEELTFRNFGFSGIHLPAQELQEFIRNTFPVYDISKVESLDEDAKRNLIRKLSIEKAKNWWASSSKQWNRLSSLEQALASNDEKAQVKALFYLRNGRTLCKGLNQKFYRSKLSKVIDKLSKSETGRVSENAKLIMLDGDYTWLLLKPVN